MFHIIPLFHADTLEFAGFNETVLPKPYQGLPCSECGYAYHPAHPSGKTPLLVLRMRGGFPEIACRFCGHIENHEDEILCWYILREEEAYGEPLADRALDLITADEVIERGAEDYLKAWAEEMEYAL